MSKTLINNILSPISIISPEAAAFGRTVLFTAVGGSLGGPFGAAIGSALAQGLNSLLAPGLPKPPGTESAIKSPTPGRESGYGEGRHFIAYGLYITDKDGNAIDVGVFHDGQVDGIISHYLGDVKITLGAGGWVQAGEAMIFGRDGNTIQVGTRLGLPTETAFSEVIARVPDQWTVDHRGDGCVTGFVISKSVLARSYQEIYPTGGPNNMPLSLAMRRQLVFDWRDVSQSVTNPATWKYSENAILHLAHYLLVRDNKDWATHFVPTLTYWTSAANDADIAMPRKGVQAVLTVKGRTSNTTLTLSTVAGLSTGMTVAISATGDTSLAETRVVVGIAGLVVSFSGGLAHDHEIGSQVTWASSEGSPATEPRYRSCLAHKHTDQHKSVIAGLLACCDGWMSPRADGALAVYSGRYYAPTVTIGPDQILSYSLQDGIEEEAALNQLAVTYVSANHAYNVVDTDVWENTSDIAARGKVLSDTLTNQVPSHSQARRLAKRKMAQVSAPKRGTCQTNAAGRIALGQRYIRLQLIDAGTTFLDAAVEIIAPVKRNVQTGGISFNWILADPNIDAWNPATEEGEPAPVGNRVGTLPLDMPIITSASPNYGTNSANGAPGVFIDLVVVGPDRVDLTWYARTRQVGAATWGEREYNDIDPGATVALTTEYVPIDAMVEVQVAYSVGDGRVSPWSASATVDTHVTILMSEDGQVLRNEDGSPLTS